jgi:hypothetical protein
MANISSYWYSSRRMDFHQRCSKQGREKLFQGTASAILGKGLTGKEEVSISRSSHNASATGYSTWLAEKIG